MSGAVKTDYRFNFSAFSFFKTVLETETKVRAALDWTKGDLEFNSALSAIMEAVTSADKYINENLPWELAKKGDTKRLGEVLGNVYLAIEEISRLLHLARSIGPLTDQGKPITP
jgi:methionyl-tRNA synthetase